MKPTAAPFRFPYRYHRNMAQVMAAEARMTELRAMRYVDKPTKSWRVPALFDIGEDGPDAATNERPDLTTGEHGAFGMATVPPTSGADKTQQLYQDRMRQARELSAEKQHARARAMRLSAARLLGTHTKAEWAAMVNATDGVCPRCEQPTEQFQKDHIIPIYAGGSDGLENLQPLCARCNTAKGPEDTNWLKVRGLA